MCGLVGKAQYSESGHLDFISVSATKFLDYLGIVSMFQFSNGYNKKIAALFNICLVRNCINTHAVCSCYMGQQCLSLFSLIPGVHWGQGFGQPVSTQFLGKEGQSSSLLWCWKHHFREGCCLETLTCLNYSARSTHWSGTGQTSEQP